MRWVRRVVVVVVLTAVLIAAGLLVRGPFSESHSPRSASSRPTLADGECTSAAYGTDVEVTLIGGFARACGQWDYGASSGSEFWRQIELAGGEDPGEQLICTLQHHRLLVEVRDRQEDGERGARICGELVGRGWRQVHPGPGAKRERLREEREAREQAREEAEQQRQEDIEAEEWEAEWAAEERGEEARERQENREVEERNRREVEAAEAESG